MELHGSKARLNLRFTFIYLLAPFFYSCEIIFYGVSTRTSIITTISIECGIFVQSRGNTGKHCYNIDNAKKMARFFSRPNEFLSFPLDGPSYEKKKKREPYNRYVIGSKPGIPKSRLPTNSIMNFHTR